VLLFFNGFVWICGNQYWFQPVALTFGNCNHDSWVICYHNFCQTRNWSWLISGIYLLTIIFTHHYILIKTQLYGRQSCGNNANANAFKLNIEESHCSGRGFIQDPMAVSFEVLLIILVGPPATSVLAMRF